MRFFRTLKTVRVEVIGKGMLTLRELNIADFDELLTMQAQCLKKEEELQQVGWSSKLDKNMLMRILVSGFILGLFNEQKQLVGYLPVYHLDPDQPISHYAKQLSGQLETTCLNLKMIGEVKKPRVRPDYRGHHLGKILVKEALKIVAIYYPSVKAMVMSLPTLDLYSPLSFLSIGFEPTSIVTQNRAGEERKVYLFHRPDTL